MELPEILKTTKGKIIVAVVLLVLLLVLYKWYSSKSAEKVKSRPNNSQTKKKLKKVKKVVEEEDDDDDEDNSDDGEIDLELRGDAEELFNLAHEGLAKGMQKSDFQQLVGDLADDYTFIELKQLYNNKRKNNKNPMDTITVVDYIKILKNE